MSCTVYVMVGLPGSGKSTYIKNNLNDLPIVSRDIIRCEIGFCGKDVKFVGTKEQEDLVTQYENNKIEYYINNNIDFVIDNINIGKWRKILVEKLRNYGCKIIMVWLKTPIDICIERRNGDIDKDIMTNINSRFVEPNKTEYDELIVVN